MEFIHLFLIVSILFLILINIYNYFKPSLREGLNETNNQSNTSTYKDYNDLETKDPMFLATKNAANISFIKSQLDELSGIKHQILELTNNVNTNTQQIDQIQQAVQDQAAAVTGGALQNTDDENQDNNDQMTEGDSQPIEENIKEEEESLL